MLVYRQGDGYVSLCYELDVASQGKSVPDARKNLEEAVQGFLDEASTKEIRDRLSTERYIETFSATRGTPPVEAMKVQTEIGSKDRFFTIVDSLIEGWCRRRELHPLRIILPAWPPPNGFSDEWALVRDSLRHIRAMAKTSLNPDEANLINEAIAILDVSLRG